MIKFLKVSLAIFLLFNLTLGQTIIENGKITKLDSDTERKASMLMDSLVGIWQLQKTIKYEIDDTIIQEPTFQIWLNPMAKPFTTIIIDSLRKFQIEQACMKCPYLHWKGQYELEIRAHKSNEFFYLNFVDTRLRSMKGKKRKRKFSLEFNGYITCFENGELTLTTKDGTEWVYKRY